MGYRSNVAIKCDEKAFELFKREYNNYAFNPDKLFKEDDLYTIYWEQVKWYEHYPEIYAIENIMDNLDKHKELGLYSFLRLGEDQSDVESRANDYDIELWLIRKIDLPGDNNKIN